MPSAEPSVAGARLASRGTIREERPFHAAKISRSTGRNKVLRCTVRSAVVRKHGSEGQCVMHSICEERGLLKPHGALEEAGWNLGAMSLRPGLGAGPRSPLRRGTHPTCD
jgi:hypothetical protein